MAATGYTPISLYYSTTASAVPLAANLANGELALNTADMKLYAKNSSGVVTLLAANSGATGTVSSVAVSGGTTGLTTSGGPITTSGTITLAGTLATANGGTGLTSFTANGVVYASSSSALATGSALQFDGTNLGLGVTPSAWNSALKALEIRTVGNGLMSGGSSDLYATSNAYYAASNNWVYANTAAASIYQLASGQHRWSVAASGTAGTAISFTQAMTLDASGNLGLGASTITGIGTGYTTMQFSGTNGSGVRFYRGATSNSLLYGDSNGLYLQLQENLPMFFWTNNTERARISAAGGFSVGTTADPGAGAIYATGNITAYYSDKRLKTVSGKIENALDKVAQLSGVYYTNNDTAKSFGYDSDEVQVGVLAQEVEAVMPQIVKAAPFDLDENGNSKSGENYKTVQYERLVPLLIEAVKELRAEVKALKGE